MEYHGIIEINNIVNSAPADAAADGYAGMSETHIRFVHYPDCQQLIIWLPAPGMMYTNYSFTNDAGEIIGEGKVADILNGSIQLLWNTVMLPPGNYSIQFIHATGGRHQVYITKHEEGWKPPVKTIEAEPVTETGPIVYRDGFGNIIEDEDLKIRKAALGQLEKLFSRRIRYEGNFRSGYIIYTEEGAEVKFYHEMGGGNCMFYIDIPTEDRWEAQTNIPLARRAEILEYMATVVQAQQASGCSYEIRGDSIVYYNNK